MCYGIRSTVYSTEFSTVVSRGSTGPPPPDIGGGGGPVLWDMKCSL